jgi:hypothetical protein
MDYNHRQAFSKDQLKSEKLFILFFAKTQRQRQRILIFISNIKYEHIPHQASILTMLCIHPWPRHSASKKNCVRHHTYMLIGDERN